VKAAVEAGTAEKLARNALNARSSLGGVSPHRVREHPVVLRRAGNVKPITELTEEEGAVLASLEVIVKNAEAGDGHTDTIHKFKLWDKTRALEALAKHFGLVTERLEVNGWDKLSAQLNHAPTVGPTAST
jgi:hypothetical protein